MRRTVLLLCCICYTCCTWAQIPWLQPAEDKSPVEIALKSNLLYDATLTPNAGVEVYVQNGWSIGGNWMYAWWSNKDKQYCWHNCGGELVFRRYLGWEFQRNPLTGHHFELYTQLLTYDVEMGTKGYLSRISYGTGIGYGYSFRINRQMNLDTAIGIGYLGGEYEKYTPTDPCYEWLSTHQRHYFGVTKLEVSLVWLIGWQHREKGGVL